MPLAANFRHVNNYRTLRQWILSGTLHADPSGTTYQEGQSTGVVEGATLTYTYDDLGQLAGFDYPKDPANWSAKVNLDYTYDTLGWVKQRDNNGTGKPMNEYMELSGQSLLKKVEYRYCRTCAGNRTERIEIDSDGETILEWLRYEMEGLNHLRIDEKYDSDSDQKIDGVDAFRVQRVYYNGPGQLGQIVKVTVWDYSGQNPTSTDYYYGYDILGNVSVISNSNGAEADQFEQDAFGNEVESSWSSPIGGITEHLTTKQYDSDLGLYYFNARWYEPIVGGFLSKEVYQYKQCNINWHLYSIAGNNPILYADPTGNYLVPLITCGTFLATHGAWLAGCASVCGSDLDCLIECYMASIREEPEQAIAGAIGLGICARSVLKLCGIECEARWHVAHHPFPVVGKKCHLEFQCWKKGIKVKKPPKVQIPVPDEFCPPNNMRIRF